MAWAERLGKTAASSRAISGLGGSAGCWSRRIAASVSRNITLLLYRKIQRESTSREQLPVSLLASVRHHHDPMGAPSAHRDLAALVNLGANLGVPLGSALMRPPVTRQ